MNDKNKWFDGIDLIIYEPLNFKAKLAIGEDAYTSLRIKNATSTVWEVAGAAGTAATVAKSSIVASTFFAKTGLLAFIGIGTAATPIGWVVAAGVITGGAWLGITNYTKQATQERVTVIPNFINTPLDILALGLFDLIAPLAMKIAAIDNEVAHEERNHIKDYFVREWGYDKVFVEKGIKFIEQKVSDYSVKSLALALAKFQKENPDCNYKSMSQEIVGFLKRIMEADGKIDEREKLAIESVENIFNEIGRLNIIDESMTCLKSVTSSAQNTFNMSIKAIKNIY